jgi:predicted MFS family arabinose efflux permease
MLLSTGPLRRTLYMTVVIALSVAALPISAVASTAGMRVEPAAAGILTAAYGLGGLLGSVGVMIRPLRSDADQLMTWLGAAIGMALCAAAFAGQFPVAVVVYSLAGVLNSFFFAATLAARSEYAPEGARGQVFVWIGALKITAGSAGTALAGALALPMTQLPLLFAAALVAVAVGASLLDRRHHE